MRAARTSQGSISTGAFRRAGLRWVVALALGLMAGGVLGPVGGAAQEELRVTGVVTDDATGAPIEGASVRLTDPAGAARETATE